MGRLPWTRLPRSTTDRPLARLCCTIQGKTAASASVEFGESDERENATNATAKMINMTALDLGKPD